MIFYPDYDLVRTVARHHPLTPRQMEKPWSRSGTLLEESVTINIKLRVVLPENMNESTLF